MRNWLSTAADWNDITVKSALRFLQVLAVTAAVASTDLFLARIAHDEKIEPQDAMPDAYRKTFHHFDSKSIFANWSIGTETLRARSWSPSPRCHAGRFTHPKMSGWQELKVTKTIRKH